MPPPWWLSHSSKWIFPFPNQEHYRIEFALTVAFGMFSLQDQCDSRNKWMNEYPYEEENHQGWWLDGTGLEALLFCWVMLRAVTRAFPCLNEREATQHTQPPYVKCIHSVLLNRKVFIKRQRFLLCVQACYRYFLDLIFFFFGQCLMYPRLASHSLCTERDPELGISRLSGAEVSGVCCSLGARVWMQSIMCAKPAAYQLN